MMYGPCPWIARVHWLKVQEFLTTPGVIPLLSYTTKSTTECLTWFTEIHNSIFDINNLSLWKTWKTSIHYWTVAYITQWPKILFLYNIFSPRLFTVSIYIEIYLTVKQYLQLWRMGRSGDPRCSKSCFWIHVSRTNERLNPPLKPSDRQGANVSQMREWGFGVSFVWWS